MILLTTARNNPLPKKAAILILAHDEEDIIAQTVAGVLPEIGPLDALLVVADNCRDATAERAREAGAQVFSRQEPEAAGKGKALAWFMHQYGDVAAGFEVLVIMDADSRLEAGFLAKMRPLLPTGEAVMQSFLNPVTSGKSPIGKLAALSELLDQCMSDSLRTHFKWPVRLRGTGMVISPALLAGVCDQLETEVEDIALTLLLASQGHPPARLEAVTVFDQKPDTSWAASEQRARWFRGQWLALWQYRFQVMKLIAMGPAGWSLLSSLFLRPKWLIVALEFLLGAALLPIPWLSIVFWLAGSLSLVYYALGLTRIPGLRPYLVALLYSPAYIWMWLHSLVLAMRASAWRRSRS
jgi:cellulose synthase/poly-beta-1,6-N-acetylglucosamine synthase-like glycosyltransferase